MWVFRLNVTNGTDRKLSVSAPDLKWGTWYTKGKDKTKPVDLPPGKTVYALGIRAARATWTGYECSCTWLDEGKDSLGAFSVYIDVPYSASNKSKMRRSGVLDVDGWEDLPKRGHEFVRNLTITSSVYGLVAAEDVMGDVIDPDEAAYLAVIDDEMAANAMITDWPTLETLQIVDQYNPKDEIPDQYLLPPREKFIARGEVADIDRSDWDGIGDAALPTPYHKKRGAERYFAVPIYSVNTNPRATKTLSAGVKTVSVSSVEVSSSIKSTMETTYSVKASLSGSYGSEALGRKVAASLESAFGLTSVTEESSSVYQRAEETITIEAVDYNRLFVPWVFSTTAAIYCEHKGGHVRLVAISQWAVQEIDHVYRM